MNKFKVGDKVIGISPKYNPYSTTYSGWRGDVISIIDKEIITVQGPGLVGTRGVDVETRFFKLSKPLTAKELNNKAINYNK